MKKYLCAFIFLAIFFTLLFLDWYSKVYVLETIPLMRESSPFYPYGGIPVFRDFMGIEFSISHIHNLGAAWGMFHNYSTALFVLRCIFILGLFIYIVFFNKEKLYQIPLVLILIGALGNVLDFMLYGYVVDMFHFIFWGYDYPLFNFADGYIFIGMVSLLILSFLHRNSERKS